MAEQVLRYPGVGCIVEFMQDNIPQIGWVMEEQNGKLRLLLPNRRETPLPGNRVLPWTGPVYSASKSKEEIVQILNSHKEKRDLLQKNVEPLSLWEMTQGEVEKEKASFFAELLTENPDADAVAACAHAMLQWKSHFRFQPPEFEVYSAETVRIRLEAEEAAREREQMVGGGSEWLRLLWDARTGKTRPDSRMAPPEPVSSRLTRILRSRMADPETQEDEHLWKQVSKGLPEDPHLPLLLATSWGLVPEHYNFWLDRADYDSSDAWQQPFTEEIQQLVNCTREMEEEAEKSGKLLPQTFISIDSSTTRDIDDGFSIAVRPEGGWNISVCLACPALIWPFQPISRNSNSDSFHSMDNGMGLFPLSARKTKNTGEGNETGENGDAGETLDAGSLGNAGETLDAGNASNAENVSDAQPENSKTEKSFDRAIFHRATSLYLPEGTYHMMPEILGTETYSLLAGTVRPSLLFHCEVDETGQILSSRSELAWVRLAANLHYDACEEFLQAEPVLLGSEAEKNQKENSSDSADSLSHEFNPFHIPSEPNTPNNSGNTSTTVCELDEQERMRLAQDREITAPYAEALRQAYAFAQARLALRIQNGAVVIEREDLEFRLEGEGAETRVILCPPHSSPRAQLLVSELMILANVALAEFAVSKEIPLLFRTQDVAVPKEFAGIWSAPQDIARVVRVLTSASLETSPRPHAGMGLQAYSPVTSPLRRYADLVNEAQLLSYMEQGEPRWNKAELDQLLSSLQIHADAAGQVQRFRPRYWRLVYIQQQAKIYGEKCGFDAIVSDENDAFVTITLTKEQLPIRGKRSLFGGKVMLGQHVRVRLGKINPLRGEIFILAVEEA